MQYRSTRARCESALGDEEAPRSALTVAAAVHTAAIATSRPQDRPANHLARDEIITNEFYPDRRGSASRSWLAMRSPAMFSRMSHNQRQLLSETTTATLLLCDFYFSATSTSQRLCQR